MHPAHSDEPSSSEDTFQDPQPLTDPLSQFLSMRYQKREAFLENLQTADRKVVQSELERIDLFRQSVQDRQLSPSDSGPLVYLLEQARGHWVDAYHRHCSTGRNQNRIGLTVEQVQDPVGKDDDYGINAWHLSLQRDKDGTGAPRHDGLFQKIPITQLFNGTDSPLKRGEEDRLRYIHLPANNMDWVEACE